MRSSRPRCSSRKSFARRRRPPPQMRERVEPFDHVRRRSCFRAGPCRVEERVARRFVTSRVEPPSPSCDRSRRGVPTLERSIPRPSALPVSASPISGIIGRNGWGARGPYATTSRTPVHDVGLTAGMNRLVPPVGAPYGTPLKIRTPPSSAPRIRPALMSTTGPAAGADACGQQEPRAPGYVAAASVGPPRPRNCADSSRSSPRKLALLRFW